MVKSSVQVIVRTRPTSNFAHENIQVDPETKSLAIHHAKDPHGGAVNNQQEDWSFKFDHVLHNASQETTYDVVAADIVQSVLEGYNGTILAYGQTGAGKTFTMTGATQNYKYRGITPRALAQIFREIQDKPETAVVVRVSYLEIYNEALFDLLPAVDGAHEDLQVMDDAKGQVSIKGLNKLVVQSEEEALHALFNGDTNRQIGSHQMNLNSSRSHTIFTVHLEMRSRVDSSEKVISSKLNLVDLAGSERIKKTGSSGLVLKEAQYINKSLSFLEQVVMALSDKNRDHVPFRQSKLTNVLRDSLGGNCKTRLVANVWVEREELEETTSTLKFATRMMKVSTDATVNVVLDPLLLVKKYERDIRELKQELAMHDALSNRGQVHYDPYTAEQQYELQQVVRAYVKGEQDEIEVTSLRQVRELFKQFRILAQNLEHDLVVRGGAQPAAAAPTDPAVPALAATAAAPAEAAGSEYVGDLSETGGLALGSAAANARPPNPIDAKMTPRPTTGAGATQSVSGGGRMASPRGVNRTSAPDEAAAFEEYKKVAGSELFAAYTDNVTQLRQKKADFRAQSMRVNRIKHDIDALSGKLEEKRAGKSQNDDSATPVIDEEEYALIRDVKAKKKEYQAVFHDRKMSQSEQTYLKGLVSQTQVRLCNEFLVWYEREYHVAPSTSSMASISMVLTENDPSAGDTMTATMAATAGNDGDQLDDGEQFEKLQKERVTSENPEAFAFFAAKKEAANTLKLKKTVRK